MTNLIPLEGATEEQIDASVASLRQDAREHVRQLLAAGAPEVVINRVHREPGAATGGCGLA